MKRIVFVAAFPLVAISVLGAAVAPPAISRLQSEKREEREKAREEILESRKVLINKLIELASEDRPADAPGAWRDSKHLSILLLGDLRAVEAVDVLFDNLTYRNPWQPFEYKYAEVGDAYPAARALAQIGMRAIPGVIERLTTSDEKTIRKNCSWVAREVLGREVGRFVVARAIEDETNAQRRARLEAALNRYFPHTK